MQSVLASHYQSRTTGKLSDKWSFYLPEYERVFKSYKESRINLLEVGVQNGGSLEVWSDYFSNAENIVGCDINQTCRALEFDSEVIHVVIGDTKKKAVLDELKAYAETFDIIIDDGSHKSTDIIQTFISFYPLLKDGGVYVIEDLHASYWKNWEGGLFKPDSAMSFLKGLTDICNQEHWGSGLSSSAYLAEYGIQGNTFINELSHLHSIEFMNSMCVIYRRSPEENLLGPRRVSGDVALVRDVRHLNGTFHQVPDESANVFSYPPHYERRLAELASQLADRDREIATLRQERDLIRVEIIRAEAQLALLKELWLEDGPLEPL